jgi:hypothetical protein
MQSLNWLRIMKLQIQNAQFGIISTKKDAERLHNPWLGTLPNRCVTQVA